MFMFKVNKSKSAIGVIALSLLVTLIPSANAGKPGSTPSLNGTLCKSFGGTWKAGKTGTCSLVNSGGSIANNKNFVINSGDTFYIYNSNFSNYATITNYGVISTIYGGFDNIYPGKVINQFTGQIYGCLSGTVDNYGFNSCDPL
jgi:hypothetical protein